MRQTADQIMNADREVVIQETLQQSLSQLKSHVWQDIESLTGSQTTPSSFANIKAIFSKARQDLEHTALLNGMLATTKPLPPGDDSATPEKCENAVAFRHIASFFHKNTERLLRQNPVYRYDYNELQAELRAVAPGPIQFHLGFLTHFTLKVSDYFVVKLIFSVDHRPAFVLVHAASEVDRSPFEQSDFRVFRTLAVYFSRVLPDFMMKYKHRGIVEFVIWLSCYENLFTTPCAHCGKLIDKDLTGDLLPPIIRTVGTCYPYHIQCAPFEIELPDFGFVTLMSEDQMQEKSAHQRQGE